MLSKLYETEVIEKLRNCGYFWSCSEDTFTEEMIDAIQDKLDTGTETGDIEREILEMLENDDRIEKCSSIHVNEKDFFNIVEVYVYKGVYENEKEFF